MRKTEITSIILHFFVGLGGMAGGLAAILEPDAPMGMPSSALVNSPFTNFLIPGLLLFFFIGVGNVLSGFLYFTRKRWVAYASGVMACGMLVWIITQCVMLQAVVSLHVIFFCLGGIQGLLALFLLLVNDLFPFNVLLPSVR